MLNLILRLHGFALLLLNVGQYKWLKCCLQMKGLFNCEMLGHYAHCLPHSVQDRSGITKVVLFEECLQDDHDHFLDGCFKPVRIGNNLRLQSSTSVQGKTNASIIAG